MLKWGNKDAGETAGGFVWRGHRTEQEMTKAQAQK